MKRILGLDLGTASIGWAVVNEAEKEGEKSSIVRMGVRVNPLTSDEQKNFEEGKSITTNADRALKSSARVNLQRYKLRRENLLLILKEYNIIHDDTILSENGNRTTFETWKLRAKSAKEKISLEEFARVLFMINSKRGYKSSRVAKSSDDGELIDGMSVALKLYEEDLTPGEYTLSLLKSGVKTLPDFYNSDLEAEFKKIWDKQSQYYPEILTNEFYYILIGKSKTITPKIFYARYNMPNSLEIKGSREEKKIQAYSLRVKALTHQLTKEELVFVFSEINGELSGSSNYLGSISDRSKELYFNKQTVGEYLMAMLDKNPNTSLKNKVFYRQDYLDEFETIWETQKKYYPQLTDELKKEIRDIVIFYQRKLKSKKGLLSFCEFESRQIKIEVNGKKIKKTTGSRVCPKSSPLFQEFRIWQTLNNICVIDSEDRTRFLEVEEKQKLYNELTKYSSLKASKILELLFDKKTAKAYKLNYEEILGNETYAKLYAICPQLASEDVYAFNILETPNQQNNRCNIFNLWHLLYSYEGDNSKMGDESLVLILENTFGFSHEEALKLKKVKFDKDYSNLSSKAIRNILPYLMQGFRYDEACEQAGYRHSKNSLTKEEIENKKLDQYLEILSKNSLRNPVVEKIINQMINVVNELVENYGVEDENGEKHFDEIRIELARELKKSAKEREETTRKINETTKDHEKIREIIKKDFHFAHVSRNDIVRYKLYQELKDNGYHTFYSNTYLPYEKIFDKDFDIEHIIPQAKLFDDSFANKTLELKSINIEKADKTAYEYVKEKYGEQGLENYIQRVDSNLSISSSKKKNLKRTIEDIPQDFIQRDLRDSQYIAKKAKELLENICKRVVSTSGSITERLRKDWEIINIMQELNWGKYDKLGMTEIIENKDGQKVYKIHDWTKRNDHRHHAMDALTIAFTKPSYIQYLNNLSARSNKSSSFFAIEKKEVMQDNKFRPPFALDEFRKEAKKHLSSIIVSNKAKNKVVTPNLNSTKKNGGANLRTQLTPRGQLHKETIYAERKQYVTKLERVNASFTEEKIKTVAKRAYREALLQRLQEYNGDAKKAFTGKNDLEKNPLYYNKEMGYKVPKQVKVVSFVKIYTIRKPITKDLKIDKVVDAKVRKVLEDRLKEYNNNPAEAFSNLDDNPIWLNKEKGISIKSVSITGINNAIALHSKKDKDGKLILDNDGNTQPVDFVSTGNNHHVAIYIDENGEYQENIVSFFEATARKLNDIPLIDKTFNIDRGWKFLFSMKQNEYFIFPNEETKFNPSNLTREYIMNPDNYEALSPNIYRVQKLTSKDYFFRHHLETTIQDNNKLKGTTWKRLGISGIKDIVKIRVNHIGDIVDVGEY